MSNAGIDVVRIVWCHDYEPLHVEPSADCPGYVRMLTKTKESEEYWGRLDIILPPVMALKLADALAACAKEQENAK